LREGADDGGAKGEDRAHPHARADAPAGAEAIGARVVIRPGRARQHTRQQHGDEARILAAPQMAPAGPLGAAEDIDEIKAGASIGEILQPQQRRMCSDGQRRERGGGDAGEGVQGGEVIGRAFRHRHRTKRMVQQQQAIGLAARMAEFLLVDQAEHL
jgi:hypothetical protein